MTVVVVGGDGRIVRAVADERGDGAVWTMKIAGRRGESGRRRASSRGGSLVAAEEEDGGILFGRAWACAGVAFDHALGREERFDFFTELDNAVVLLANAKIKGKRQGKMLVARGGGR